MVFENYGSHIVFQTGELATNSLGEFMVSWNSDFHSAPQRSFPRIPWWILLCSEIMIPGVFGGVWQFGFLRSLQHGGTFNQCPSGFRGVLALLLSTSFSKQGSIQPLPRRILWCLAILIPTGFPTQRSFLPILWGMFWCLGILISTSFSTQRSFQPIP